MYETSSSFYIGVFLEHKVSRDREKKHKIYNNNGSTPCNFMCVFIGGRKLLWLLVIVNQGSPDPGDRSKIRL